MHRLKNIGLIPFSLGIYIICYVFLPWIIGKELSSLVKMMLLGLMFFFIILFAKEDNRYLEYESILIPGFSIYFFFNLIFWWNLEILRWGVNIVLFFIFYRYSSYKCFYVFSFIIKFMTLICTFFIFTDSLYYGEWIYDRAGGIMDKSYLTYFLALTYFFCVVDILYNRHTIFNMLSLFFCLVVNIMVIQSKTSLFAFVINLVLLFCFYSELRRMIKKYIKYLIPIGIIFFVFFVRIPSSQEDLKYGINRVLSFELFDEANFIRTEDRLGATFDIRKDVREYCFELFWDNPIFGIGQGNYKFINQKSDNYFNQLSDTESSWLQILVEGGIYYIFIMAYFFLKPINDIRRKLKYNPNSLYSYYYVMSFSFFITCFVMYFFNDFTDSLFWISAGIMVMLISCDTDKLPQIGIKVK